MLTSAHAQHDKTDERDEANSEQPQSGIDRWFGGRLPLAILVIILVIYVAFALTFSQVTPFNKGPDEGINLDYMTFIVANNRLPITYAERELVGPKANWPALYHVMSVGLGKIFGVDVERPPTIKIFWDSFRYRAIDVETDQPWYLLTEDQAWPYYNTILILHLGRWLSVFFSTLTLLLIYFTVIEILPRHYWLAIGAVALLGFIPMYIFIGSVLNEDALVACLATLYFWLLVRIIKWPRQTWRYWGLGLVMGLSVTAKYTTIILPLEVLIIFAIIVRHHGFSWLWWVKRVAIVGISSMLAAAWWFGWNFWFLNEIETLGLFGGLLRPLLTGGTDVTMARLGNIFTGGQIGLAELPQDVQVGTFLGWVRATFFSFWAVGIGGVTPLFPDAFYGVGLLIVVSIIGLGRRWRMDLSSRPWLMLLTFHTLIFFIAPLVRFWLSRRLGQTAQGRHVLIPAAACVALLLAWGVATAMPRRWQRLVLALVAASFIGWTGLHIQRMATFAPPLLPLRTVAQAADWLSNPVNVRFGESVALTSYALEPQPTQNQLALNLAWHALGYANENYRLKVKLIDIRGETTSHWLGYHAQGRVPTLAWDPGDVVFDRLILPLPAQPASDYIIQIELLSNSGPLQITSTGEQGDSITWTENVLSLAPVSIPETGALSLAKNVAIIGDALPSPHPINFDLWRSNGPIKPNTQPTYRYPATISVLTESADLLVNLMDETGRTWFPTASEANIHTFIIGPQWRSGDYYLQFVQHAENTPEAQAITEPVLRVENWWSREFKVPDIPVPMEANFADQINFLGYKLPQDQVKAGEAFPITLYWQAPLDKSPQAEFTQFNNLLDSNGQLRGGYDRQPLEYYNTLLWAPGEVVADGYAISVDADAPPGEYYLDVGYYLLVGESAVNLPLVVEGQMTEVSSVTIGPITVVGP